MLVVGGGIYGAMIARAAAAQHLRVALIDQNDFGHGTTANSQRIVHGGLRYLQQLDIRRMRQSIVSRRRLMKAAPHLVEPLKVVVPTRRRPPRDRASFRCALLLNDAIAWDRNKGLSHDRQLPRGYTISRAECRDLIPGLEHGSFTGGAVWFDAVARAERVALEFALRAARQGATVCNYVKAVEYSIDDEAISAVRAEDMLAGGRFEICARFVIDATGPWHSPPTGGPGSPTRLPSKPVVLGANLVVDRLIFGDYAVGLFSPTLGRDLFFVPWRGRTLVGTLYYDDRGPHPTAQDVRAFLRTANEVYPPATLRLDDVAMVLRGRLPADGQARTKPDQRLLSRPIVRDRPGGIENLLTVAGVKFTTAIQVADEVVELAMKRLGKRPAPEPEDAVERAADRGLELESSPSAGVAETMRRAAQRAVRDEMAQTLADFVLRRADLCDGGHPGRLVLENAAHALAKELDWHENRILREIQETEQLFIVAGSENPP